MRGLVWAMQYPDDEGLWICVVAGSRVFFRSGVGTWQERGYSIEADADAIASLLTANWEFMGLHITAGPMEFVVPDKASRTAVGRSAEQALLDSRAYAVV